MDVQISEEDADQLPTIAVYAHDLEPIVEDPDVDGCFTYSEGKLTHTFYREYEDILEDVKSASFRARASIAWYRHLHKGE